MAACKQGSWWSPSLAQHLGALRPLIRVVSGGSLLPQQGMWGSLGGHGVTCPTSVTHSNLIVVELRALPTSQNLQPGLCHNANR